jgi:hypothetical protein
MKSYVGGDWHRTAGDLENAFVERGFLLCGREFADFGEIDVMAGVEDVTANDPVGGNGIVEPGEFGFVGVAVVARGFQDLFYFGWGLEVGGDGRVVEGEAEELEGEEEEDEGAGGAEKESEHWGRDFDWRTR